uniref:Uncharacterized protein n=1 Tax=Pipistrellus kuhlii TaxID=59472 RepID=A0A7J7YWY7_PIPKU|nr:hypothetical protein mPipKuh1_009945 [Pipistrellus kuhlii]
MCGGSWAGSVNGSRTPAVPLCPQGATPHPTVTCPMTTHLRSSPGLSHGRILAMGPAGSGELGGGVSGILSSQMQYLVDRAAGEHPHMTQGAEDRGPGTQEPSLSFQGLGVQPEGAEGDGQEVGQSLGRWPQELPQKTLSQGG